MNAYRSPLWSLALLAAVTGCSSSSPGAGNQSPAPDGGGTSADASGSSSDAQPSGDDGSTSATQPETGSMSQTPVCNANGAVSACDQCQLTSCCAQSQDCLTDPDCEEYYRCMRLNADGEDAGTCDADGGDTVSEYTAYNSCVQSSCSTSCATCHGTALPCSSFGSESLCEAMDCAWDNDSCSGILPPECGLIADSATCAEAGCQWSY